MRWSAASVARRLDRHGRLPAAEVRRGVGHQRGGRGRGGGADQVPHERRLVLGGQRRVGQRHLQVGGAVHGASDAEQLVLDAVERAVRLRHGERGLGTEPLDRVDHVDVVRPACRHDLVEHGERGVGHLASEEVAHDGPAGAGRLAGVGERLPQRLLVPQQPGDREQVARDRGEAGLAAACVQGRPQRCEGVAGGSEHQALAPFAASASRSAMNRSTVARARASSSRDSPTTLPASDDGQGADLATQRRDGGRTLRDDGGLGASRDGAQPPRWPRARASSMIALLSACAWARIWAASVRASAS